LKRTPFYAYAAEHGAKFVDFAGWEMPISFGSIMDEHQQVRNSGGLFDVSHMGRIKFSGRHARRLLEKLVTRRLSDMEEKRCRYALLCNERGGVRDDVLIYRYAEHWLMVCNAANRAKILEHIEAVRTDEVAKVEDLTESTAMLAIQGPKVMDVVGKFSKEVPTLPNYGFAEKNLMILKMTISRTGYTGEDGIEIILGANMANMAMKLLMRDQSKTADIQPCGLAARDSLRLEAAMPLYGHELDEETDPFAAGLGFAVQLDKDQDENGVAFVGQEALKQIKEQGPSKVLVGLALEGKRTPRQDMKVFDGDTEVGAVTSGCLSPTLGYPIAMAYVKPGLDQPGMQLNIDFGRAQMPAQVVKLPFYRRAKK
jgi:aminomethyltransferase